MKNVCNMILWPISRALDRITKQINNDVMYLGRQVQAQVRAQVGAQVWDQVSDQVGVQVKDQVWAQVRDDLKEKP